MTVYTTNTDPVTGEAANLDLNLPDNLSLVTRGQQVEMVMPFTDLNMGRLPGQINGNVPGNAWACDGTMANGLPLPDSYQSSAWVDPIGRINRPLEVTHDDSAKQVRIREVGPGATADIVCRY